MKTKTIGLTLAFCFLAGSACFAANSQMGSWKLNEAKSKLTPGVGKITMVVYKTMLGQVKATVDGTDDKGKPTHNQWTGKFDGKDYPVTGDPTSDARSYPNLNHRPTHLPLKKHAKLPPTAPLFLHAH